MELKIVSWNIAGGRKYNTSELFSYEDKEDLQYFQDQLKKLAPDIICLQESHTNDKRSLAQELSKNLDMPYVFNTPASPSHIDNDYQLGNAIISKFEINHSEVKFYPNPSFELFFKDGRKAIQHPKNLQIVKIGNISIANTQILPIVIFGYEYDRDKGAELAKKIEEVLMSLKAPLLLCGDFNYNKPETIYPNLFANLKLKEALPDRSTRPDGNNTDHIYYSSEFKLLESKVISTLSDHYLCYAKFEVD